MKLFITSLLLVFCMQGNLKAAGTPTASTPKGTSTTAASSHSHRRAASALPTSAVTSTPPPTAAVFLKAAISSLKPVAKGSTDTTAKAPADVHAKDADAKRKAATHKYQPMSMRQELIPFLHTQVNQHRVLQNVAAIQEQWRSNNPGAPVPSADLISLMRLGAQLSAISAGIKEFAKSKPCSVTPTQSDTNEQYNAAQIILTKMEAFRKQQTMLVNLLTTRYPIQPVQAAAPAASAPSAIARTKAASAPAASATDTTTKIGAKLPAKNTSAHQTT